MFNRDRIIRAAGVLGVVLDERLEETDYVCVRAASRCRQAVCLQQVCASYKLEGIRELISSGETSVGRLPPSGCSWWNS